VKIPKKITIVISQITVNSILEQLTSLESVSARKMFGEYALYYINKVVALICDDTLLVKITPEGKAFIGNYYNEGFAYPGAKASMKIDASLLDDAQWLQELIMVTEKNLPEMHKKVKKFSLSS
jgi:TfoX/Sxy family transcriptional regulator of competence genes